MPAALIELAVELDVLQAAVVHVGAECGYGYVEDVPDKEYRIAMREDPAGKNPSTT